MYLDESFLKKFKYIFFILKNIIIFIQISTKNYITSTIIITPIIHPNIFILLNAYALGNVWTYIFVCFRDTDLKKKKKKVFCANI